MRHNKKHGMKLGTDASHTKAMKKSLVCALFENDRIKTLDQRAKAIRPDVDRIITWAKKGDLASRRNAIAKMGNADLVREVFEKAAQGMWADRNGGYTRIMKLGPRKGDGAPMVIMELCTEPVKKKAKKTAEPVKAAKKVEEPEVVEEETEEIIDVEAEAVEEGEEAAEVAEEAAVVVAEEAAEVAEEATEEAAE